MLLLVGHRAEPAIGIGTISRAAGVSRPPPGATKSFCIFTTIIAILAGFGSLDFHHCFPLIESVWSIGLL